MNATISSDAAPAKRKVGFLLGIGILFLPIVFAWFLLRDGHTTRARVIGFIWLALVTLGAISRSQDAAHTAASKEEAASTVAAQEAAPAETKSAEDSTAKSAIMVSAQQLYAAYHANEISADQSYKGKMLEVTGVVDSIDSDFNDEPRIALRGESGESFLAFVYAEGIDANTAAALRKGQNVTVVCTGGGEAMGFPTLDDCAIR